MTVRRIPNSGGNAEMKKYVVASLLVVGLATPALAAEKSFMTVDTVGNCSVVQGSPSAGQTVIGETSGYA